MHRKNYRKKPISTAIDNALPASCSPVALSAAASPVKGMVEFGAVGAGTAVCEGVRGGWGGDWGVLGKGTVLALRILFV